TASSPTPARPSGGGRPTGVAARPLRGGDHVQSPGRGGGVRRGGPGHRRRRRADETGRRGRIGRRRAGHVTPRPAAGDGRNRKAGGMDLQLTGETALVTGSTAGIGFAIASLLAREGAAVVVNGRSAGRVEEAVRRIAGGRADSRVTGVAADLGTKDGVALQTGKVPAVDILVNNLGIFEPKPFP